MMLRVLPIFVLLTLAGGCASTYQRLDAEGANGQLGTEARYVVENAEGRVQATIFVAAEGRYNRRVDDDRRTDMVRFTFLAENPSGRALEIPLDRFRARDDRGRLLPLLDVGAAGDGPESDDGRLPVVADVTFDAGTEDLLAEAGAIVLEWYYVFDGREVTHETRFIPIEERSYGSSFGVGVGFGWSSHHHHHGRHHRHHRHHGSGRHDWRASRARR